MKHDEYILEVAERTSRTPHNSSTYNPRNDIDRSISEDVIRLQAVGSRR